MKILVFIFSLLFSVAVVVSTADSHSQSNPLSARSLNALFRARAFKALSRRRVKTGVIVPATVPVSLAGISISAVRLRSGSLRSRGVKSYGEFRIPPGVTEQPYAKRVGLVYQNLGNLSSEFYPLPGFDYLSPVLGLIAYDAVNLTTSSDPPELDLIASAEPISARFGSKAKPLPRAALCVFFDLHGSVQFDRPVKRSWCELVRQGHLAVAIESAAPSPAPSSLRRRSGGTRKIEAGKILAWCLGGGFAVVVVAAAVIIWVKAVRRKTKSAAKEKESGGDRSGESLDVTSFGGIRAPFARVTRTQPVLEDRYVPY